MPIVSVGQVAPQYHDNEPFNVYSHGLLGFCLLCATVPLIWHGFDNVTRTIAFAVYTLTGVATYGISALYHYAEQQHAEDTLLYRRLDHSMIIVRILGAYAPICWLVIPEDGGVMLWLAMALLTVLWFLRFFLSSAMPSQGSAPIAVCFGIMPVAYGVPVLDNLPIIGLLLLVFGSVFFIVGALIYYFHWPRISATIGPHEMLHLSTYPAECCFLTFMFYL